jgi:glycosyltransferase involved in cell wall biosynthesis
MLEGESIICFAHDWGGDPTSKTHIMRILSRRNRILWVNSIGMRRPTASGRDFRRLLRKLTQGLRGCARVEENLYVWNPLVLPFPGVPGVDWLNSWILVTLLRRLTRRLGMQRPILWTFLPNVNRLAGRLGERMVIYHCVDEYAAFSGVPREALQRMERDLLGKADLVFTSSEQLCSERRPYNPKTFFVSHGVDLDHFLHGRDPQMPIPIDMAGIRRPIVGFFGLIADWVDLELIRHAAIARPHWSFVLLGKSTTDLNPIRTVANIHYLGQKPYKMLPNYCKEFDVGVVPFRINELTLKSNPLKLREYLAAGLPVVATDLPEIRRYSHLVKLASGPEDFVRNIEVALAERGESLVAARVSAMRVEGWEARVEELSALIETSEA